MGVVYCMEMESSLKDERMNTPCILQINVQNGYVIQKNYSIFVLDAEFHQEHLHILYFR